MQKPPPKLSLAKLLDRLEPSKRDLCWQVLEDYHEIITVIPGAQTKHQTWEGGYISHVEEAMNICIGLYGVLSARRSLSFSLADALFCIFWHDFDKVLRFRKQADGSFMATKSYGSEFTDKIAELARKQYGYEFTADEYNAIKYAHGEGKDYHPSDRIMGPLATIVHCSDVISARIWFDEGRDPTAW
jgi:hypothetical protein